MLTAQIKSPKDIPNGDFRHDMPRFQPENFHLNLKLVSKLEEVAQKQGCTPAQLSIAWVRQASSRLKSSPRILPIPGATTVARVEENTKVVTLSQEAIEDINKILDEVEVAGGRYQPGHPING